ncbi:MAG: MFS transporter, partial [Pseudomonadota bacterium]
GTRLKALRQPQVASLLAVQFCFMGAFYGSYSFIGDHIRTTLNVSAATAGQIVLAYGAGFGLASLADGVLDRIGARRGLPIAMALTVGVHVALAPATAVITTAILAGGIWGLTNHYAINLIVLRLTEVGGARRGSVLALNSAVTYLGALVGPLAAGALYTGAGFWAVTLFGTGLLATGTAIAATLALRTRTHAAVAP